MHVSGDRASENADAVGATNNINAVGTNVCAARSSGNYLLPVGSRSRLRAYKVSMLEYSSSNPSQGTIFFFYIHTIRYILTALFRTIFLLSV